MENPSHTSSTPIEAIEHCIARDLRGRGIANLVQWGALERAARLLVLPRRVVIVSGFYLPVAQAGETDGPPGAKAVGEALQALGGQVVYVTDPLNAPLFHAMGLTAVREYAAGLLDDLAPEVLLATERPGRAADGRYYNMAGQDVSASTAPIDEMFIQGRQRGVPTVAIGDGGNEIGMGNVRERVRRDIPRGDLLASVVEVDHLIVAGVSNFGAYGLAGALSVLSGRDLLPDAIQAAADIQACVAAGGCCGHTFRNEPLVDGLPLEDSLGVIQEIRALAGF